MITAFLLGFCTSLVPSFIVYLVWTVSSALSSIDPD